MGLAFHPLADIFPLLDAVPLEELVEDIRAHGLRERITLLDNTILDGRNRYRALEVLVQTGEVLGEGWGALAGRALDLEDITPKVAHARFNRFDLGLDGDPLAFVISKNLRRRHLNESQRAMVAARIANLAQGQRQTGQLAGVATQAEAATVLNVGERSVRRAREVLEDAEPEIVKAVDGGKLAVSEAAKAAKLSPETQRTIAERAEAGEGNVVRTTIKKASRAAREETLGAKQRGLPDAKFGVVYADPEWRFEVRSEKGLDRAAGNHYPTSTTEAIEARPVGKIAADDCVLFLWATAPMLLHALDVMEAWGFTYKTHCIWHKTRPGEGRGTGYWFTGEHELLLLGTRGNVPAPATALCGSVIQAAVGAHSVKPEVFYDLIESAFPSLPKIELNARRAREGWTAWGFEAPDG